MEVDFWFCIYELLCIFPKQKIKQTHRKSNANYIFSFGFTLLNRKQKKSRRKNFSVCKYSKLAFFMSNAVRGYKNAANTFNSLSLFLATLITIFEKHHGFPSISEMIYTDELRNDLRTKFQTTLLC